MRARLVAVLVHAVTLALLVAAVLLWLSPVWIVFRVIGALLLLGIVWQVRPRPVPLPEGAVLDRRNAPALFTLLDEIATVGRTPVPARVLLDTLPRSTSSRGGGGTFVSVGLPLWTTSTPPARIALLAEQLGRLGSGAAVVDPVVVSALQTLTDWRYFFNPSRAEADRRLDILGQHFVYIDESEGSFTDLVLPVLLGPLYLLVTGLRRLLVSLAQADVAVGQQRGREVTVQVAGPGAAVALDRLKAAAEATHVSMETASRRDPKADLWAIGEARIFSDEGFGEGAVRLTSEAATAVDAEVQAAAGAVVRMLRDTARS